MRNNVTVIRQTMKFTFQSTYNYSQRMFTENMTRTFLFDFNVLYWHETKVKTNLVQFVEQDQTNG